MSTILFDAAERPSAVESLSNWLEIELPAGRRVPNPIVVLVASALSGFTIVALYLSMGRYGWHMPMYRKEGFLENLTFFLGTWSWLLCVFAATHTYRQKRDVQDTVIVIGYLLCGALLFFDSMEEISWGQQLITFQTPEVWRALNHQGELTLHNLATKEELTFTWKVVGVCFLTGVMGLTVVAKASDFKVLRCIAPPVALWPLAALIAFAAVRVHPEVAEVLMSIFFAFYSYRIYVASPARRL